MSTRILFCLLGLLIYVLVVSVLGVRGSSKRVLKTRLEKIQLSDLYGADDAEQLNTPLKDRVLKPMFGNVTRLVGMVAPLSKKSQDQLGETLRKAGIKQNPKDYFARKVTVCIFIAIGVFLFTLVTRMPASKAILYVFFAVAAYYVMSRFMLGKKVTGRADAIENQMPEILDLLSVSVSAGLGFDQALAYVVERCKGELSAEFGIVQREILLGKSRNESLKAMADRCDVESLRMFVSAVVQADTLGIAIANILQIQAENARQRHKQRVEEKAAKLPVKILIPLVFFIFPNIFIVLLGPAIPQIMSAF